ncbi:MAG: ATP-binding cassette domain-containing protein [Planctomycetota bacterium]
MSDNAPLLRLNRVSLGYGGAPILVDIDLEVRRGELLAFVGRNGSGKSTLLAALLGTLPPLTGTREGAPRFGYAPQRGELDPVFPFLSEETVAMGLVGRGRTGRGDRRAKVATALATAGLAEQARVPFRDLSGGQRQRAMIARALVAEPEVVVLDEPTNDLDVQGQAEVVALLRRLHAGGTTLVLVSHDLELVCAVADRVGVLRDGHLTMVEPEAIADPEARTELLGLSAAL